MHHSKFKVGYGPACALLVLGLSVATSAMAGVVHNLDIITQAPGVCRAALGTNEAKLRARPLVLENEGTSTVFVSCALPQFLWLSDEAMGIRTWFTNMGSSDVTVSCTAVVMALQGFTYVTQSMVVPPGTHPGVSLYSLTWTDDLDAFPGYNYTNLSCALPPGAGISRIVSYGDEVVVPPED